MKKIFISHRGNLNGPNLERENSPDYIDEALNAGFDVEVDLWVIDKKLWLGHDSPQYKITKDYINDRGYECFWIHCKNFDAINFCIKNGDQYFTHDKDDYCLISNFKTFIWTFPRNLPLSKNSIAVMPELVLDWDLSKVCGICSDFITEYKKDINFKPLKKDNGVRSFEVKLDEATLKGLTTNISFIK